MAVGFAALVALITLGEGVKRQIDQQFQRLGYDSVIISAGTQVSPNATEEFQIDLDRLQAVEGVRYTAAVLNEVATIEAGSTKGFFPIIGIDSEWLSDFSEFFPEVVEGSWSLEVGERVMIDKDLAVMFNLNLGEELLIEQRPFTIVGIFKRDPAIATNTTVISLGNLQALFDLPPNTLSLGLVKVQSQ